MTLYLHPSQVPDVADWLSTHFPGGLELTRENCERLALSTEKHGGRWRLVAVAEKILDAHTLAAFRDACNGLWESHWKVAIKERSLERWQEQKLTDWLHRMKITGGIFYECLAHDRSSNRYPVARY